MVRECMFLIAVSLVMNLCCMEKKENDARETFLQLIYTCGEAYSKAGTPSSRHVSLSNLTTVLATARENGVQFDDQESKPLKKRTPETENAVVEISLLSLKSELLHEAIEEGHLPCVEELVQHINPTTCSPHEGQTPLQLAETLALRQIGQSQASENNIKIFALLARYSEK